ncbi:MAG: hypothetical protein ABI837_03190, partial [Acidobacteriota bacterium]
DGKDRPIEGPAKLSRPGEMSSIGFPADGITDPDTGRPFAPGDSPVQFNRSSILAFSTDGTATPGTIYLSAGTDAAAIRCADSGYTNIRYYDGSSRSWQP